MNNLLLINIMVEIIIITFIILQKNNESFIYFNSILINITYLLLLIYFLNSLTLLCLS
ncbi:hypothetical protein [Candidatus Portiera aleyrodidarum]|uniref:Uncharacterized protein n=1 Tax=Candidatus Portiera aleyrodidarum TaxID=91844 RepID=A0A6S6RY35_9GAMM|nr:hypothetical protein [Candidatus Portiera aleyrodidarum]CAA3704570.1 hypothetical protein PEMO_0010 [Candidatus Portiera aleyrodidarum]